MTSNKGFTLIEVIVTLILVGIMATVAGMGLVTATRGYLFASNNNTLAQKGQLAMARVTRELMEVTDISAIAIAPTSVTYKRLETVGNTTSEITRTIGLVANRLKLDGLDLVDHVQSFNLTYNQGTASWAVDTADPDHIKLLSTITMQLVLSRPDGGDNITLNTVINPRNNSNAGGALPPSPTTQPQYRACFIATAAYGDERHPAVASLRQFRDKYLMTNESGKQFIRAYYAIGPYIADFIREKPWACLLTQGLLLPVVGLSAVLVNMPSLLLLMILVSWVLAHLFLKARKKDLQIKKPALSIEKGSILIGLIITMVILAVLSAALLSMTSTSLFTQVAGNQSTQAYYVAESGFRYAASEFFNAGAIDQKFKKMADLGTYNGTAARKLGTSPSGKYGQFEINVTPYFLVFSGASGSSQSGSTVLLRYPGNLPPAAYQLSTGTDYSVKLYGELTTRTLRINSGLGTAVAPYSCTITPAIAVSSPFLNYTSVRFVTKRPTGSSGNVTLAKNDNLTLDNAGPFPDRNGVFTAKNAEYRYAYKDGNVLYNISGAQNVSYGLPLTLSSTDEIVLNEFVVIKSTGTVGGVSREVSYRTPVGQVSLGATAFSPGTESSDRMADMTKWHESTLGPYAIVTADGDSAMRGTTVSPTTWAIPPTAPQWVRTLIQWLQWLSDLVTGFWSFIAQNAVNFTPTWLHQDNLLSYETQVKTARGTWSGETPPSRYVMGLCFKVTELLDANGNSDDVNFYGISFIRSTRQLIGGDEIPNDLVPSSGLNDVPLVLLWQKIGHDVASSDSGWLAYKVLGPQVAVTATQTFSRGDTIRQTSATSRTATITNVSTSGTTATLTLKGTGVNTANYFPTGEAIQQYYCSSGSPCGSNPCCDFCLFGGCLSDGTRAWRAAGTISNFQNDPAVDSAASHVVDWATLEVGVTDNYVSTASPPVKTAGKYNLIRAYYGAPATSGSPDGTPTDLLRYGYARGADPFVWPKIDAEGNLVYPWTPAATYDKLTMVKWDGWNTSRGATEVGTGGESGSVIRSSRVVTPYSGTSLTTPEIMLHASSQNGEYLFFDDFGIRYEGGTNAGSGLGFLPPIQQ